MASASGTAKNLSSGERIWAPSHSYDEVIRKLDNHYRQLHIQILRYQGPVLGLFPESTSADCTTADIRVSIYCAVACWALSLAYKRIDDDQGRCHELGQSAVKTMRGILYCWLKQADKIERFKNNQCPACALHNHFDMNSGEPCMDECYNHLQIDVISLYLLFLVQMISAGLEIVHTTDEVNFIQNMIFYIERAYRTPDFGIWERGTKYNVGERELHASSIGMAKTALESISGFNLFGSKGAAWSVIFVDIDAHNRNRTIFDTILPRESNSKNSDAGLLTTVGWPAFAVHDQNLRDRTIDKCQRKLEGIYGYKRFLRDGLGCVAEDPSIKFYRSAELKNFDGIECEWPMFYCFRIIDGFFKRDDDMINSFWEKLESTIIHTTHQGPLIPKYYYVTERSIGLERAHPGSQLRLPSEQGSKEGSVFLWGQSVYFIAQLLTEKALSSIDIDPIRRSLPAVNRPKFHVRYSSFQGVASDLVIQIALIAESVRLQQMLATFGILAQTPHEIDPIQIWSPNTLTHVHQTLGVNEKLGLSGRPSRPWGVLSTSKIYRINGRTVVCYPLIFEQSDFYHSQDMALVLDDVIVQIEFLANRWRLEGRPTFVMIIREENIRDPNVKKFFELLAGLKAGHCGDVKVRTGRLQSFLSSACIEHLDFVRSIPEELGIRLKSFEELDVGTNYRSLTNLPRHLSQEGVDSVVPHRGNYEHQSNGQLVDTLRNTENMVLKALCLHILLDRHHLHHEIYDQTIEEWLMDVGHQAGVMNNWYVARYCASLLGKIVDSLAPGITTVLVRGKQVTMGIARHEEETIDMPLPPDDIKQIIFSKVFPLNTIEAVLQQEMILSIAKYIVSHPELFEGMLRIRIGWILEAMRISLVKQDKDPRIIEYMSPYELRLMTKKILRHKIEVKLTLNAHLNRQLCGALHRVPRGFYDQVWTILERTPSGILIANHHLEQQPTLSDMTQYDLYFSLQVEELLSKMADPAYRQIVVELLVIVATILVQNPQLRFEKAVDVDKLIRDVAGGTSQSNAD